MGWAEPGRRARGAGVRRGSGRRDRGAVAGDPAPGVCGGPPRVGAATDAEQAEDVTAVFAFVLVVPGPAAGQDYLPGFETAAQADVVPRDEQHPRPS